MANPYIGRLRSIGLGKETTKGTIVQPTHWIPVEDGSVNPVAEIVNDESSQGRIEGPSSQHVMSVDTSTEFSAPVRSEWIGLLLSGLMGSPTSALAGGESAVWEHTYEMQNDNNHPAFSVVVKDGVGTYGSPYSQFASATFKVDARDLLKVDTRIVGQKLEGDSETVAYIEEKLFRGQDTSVKIEDDITDLTGGTAIPFHSLEFSIDNNLTQHYEFDSDTLGKNLNTMVTVQGTLERLHTDDTYKDMYTAGTTKAMRIAFDNPDTIGTAENASLQFDFADIKIIGYEQSGGNDDPVSESIEWRANFDITEATPQMLSVLLTNESSGSEY